MQPTQSTIIEEEQFKIMAESAPVLIWIAGIDKRCYFFNSGWLKFTGRQLDQEIGNGWTAGVHPKDFDLCLETYGNYFDKRKDFTIEYRLKRNDGIYRWVTCNGVPRYLKDGSFAGYIGTCVDVDDLLNNQRIKTEMLNSNSLFKEHEFNEKLAATNEELAASNEEILAANEELSSAQEKLNTLNTNLEEIVYARTIQLSLSEERYRNLVANAPVAIGTLTGRDFIITSANDMILQLWGKNRSIMGMKLEEALPEIKGQPFLNLLDNVFSTSETFYGNEIKAVLEHDGIMKESYFNFIYTAQKNERRETDSIVILAIDVTEQVESRIKVENAHNRLYSMISTVPIGMTILKGKDLSVEIANQQMLEVWHRDEEQVMGKPIWDIFPELEAREFKALIASVFETGKAVKIPEMLSPHPEKESYIDLSYYPIFDKNGNAESILVTVIDITERVNNRKSIEQNQKDLQVINQELVLSNSELIATNIHLEEVRNALENSMTVLSANENKFRFMLNAIPQQVWTATPEGEMTYVNEVVCQDFGYTTEEIVGHGWEEFIHPADIATCLEKWIAALASGEEYMVEFRLRFADGEYYWHLGRAIPLIEDGRISLWLGTNTNIQIQKKNEEIKDEFLSIASHELKTPLTTIKAYNQMMVRSNTSEAMGVFIKKSSEQIFRLEKLIMDLLDVTKINAGKLSYNMEVFNFGKMLKTSIESMQHTSLRHQLILSEVVAIEYLGDRFRMEQVIHNFLSNAIKYSPNGNKILIDCIVEDQNIIVSIKDFGIGIAEENLNKLFDRYYRVDNVSMRFDGLGLGLFISSEILKRHQGNFWIESTEGEGSTFYFALPIYQNLKSTSVQRDDYYQDEHITISYNPALNTIYSNWKGFQNFKTIQNAGSITLQMIKKYSVTKVLNDNTHLLGTWSESSDWVGMELLPMLHKEGLKYLAWIYSKNNFSKRSANKSAELMTEDVDIGFFNDVKEAEMWLSTKN